MGVEIAHRCGTSHDRIFFFQICLTENKHNNSQHTIFVYDNMFELIEGTTNFEKKHRNFKIFLCDRFKFKFHYF